MAATDTKQPDEGKGIVETADMEETISEPERFYKELFEFEMKMNERGVSIVELLKSVARTQHGIH